MKIKLGLIWVGLCVFLLVWTYRSWMSVDPIIGGDWPYRWPEVLFQLAQPATAWDNLRGGGLGGISPSYFLELYNFVSARITVSLGIPWVLFYKIVWFFGPIFLLALGGFFLSGRIITMLTPWARLLSAIIFSTNTYILMVAGGGQIGVMAAVSVTPWVLLTMHSFLTRESTLLRAIIFGLLYGFQMSLDPRIAYVTACALCLLFFVYQRSGQTFLRQYKLLLFAIVQVVFLNAYWIVPLMVLGENPLETLGSVYTSVEALKFFSFADYPHALSLLHPNWPENLFGLTHFLQAEFLLLPILAFFSLGRGSKIIFALATLGLVGAFLSKGANQPAGSVYTFFFENLPGFFMFRDPTKFYVLTVISYGLLIPYTLQTLYSLINPAKIRYIVPLLFIFFWIFTIRQAVFGNLGGTFLTRDVPQEYRELKDWLVKEPGFFRTLWVPRQHRFAYSSTLQSPVEAEPLLSATDSASLTRAFSRPDILRLLEYLGFRYIIIGSDPYGELFLDDRKYSDSKRMELISVLDQVPALSKIQNGPIALYKTAAHKDLFWLENGPNVSWIKRSNDSYAIVINATADNKLYMSQTYHSGWQVVINGKNYKPEKEIYGIMSFAIPAGNYSANIEFAPRKWFIIGRILSAIVFIGSVLIMVYLTGRKQKK